MSFGYVFLPLGGAAIWTDTGESLNVSSSLVANALVYKTATTGVWGITASLSANTTGVYRADNATLPLASTLAAATKFYPVALATLPVGSKLSAVTILKAFVSATLPLGTTLAANALEYDVCSATLPISSTLAVDTTIAAGVTVWNGSAVLAV